MQPTINTLRHFIFENPNCLATRTDLVKAYGVDRPYNEHSSIKQSQSLNYPTRNCERLRAQVRWSDTPKVQTLGEDTRDVSKVEEDRLLWKAVSILPSQAHISLCICHVFSSTIGLLNVLCRILAYVKTGYITENISHKREQIAYKGRIGNARAEIHAWVVVIDGLGLSYTDSWSRAPTRSQRVASYY